MGREIKEGVNMIVPDSIDFEMRGGSHPNPLMNTYEKQVAEGAFNLINSNPAWSELSYKTAYNFQYLNTFYGTRDPKLIDLLYQLQPYPSMIEMEVTQAVCPLRCKFCELTYWDEKPIQLSLDKFKYAMDQFPELKWAGNNALGDPFTNPNYYDMVKYLDDKGVAQEIYMTTFLLEEADMKKFIDLKAMMMTKISFDGATKETYEKVHQGGDFDKAIRNIKALDRYKRKAGRYFPQLEFHYIITKENIHEAERFVDLIDSLNVFTTNIMFSRLLHNFKEVNDIYTEVPQDLIERLINKGKGLGIPVSVNGDARTIKPPANDCTQWLMPYIFPDGTIIPCCCMNEQNRRWWQREHSMGNIFDTPFREIWEGERYKKLRTNLRNKKIPDASAMCAICNINDITCGSGKNET